MRSTIKERAVAEVSGIHEHVTATSGGAGPGGGVELKGARQYAPTKSPVERPASNAHVDTPGDLQDARLCVAAADPRMLAVGQTGMPNASVSADRKSYAIEGADDWKWTATPTVVNEALGRLVGSPPES
jgi:hypothetical protein